MEQLPSWSEGPSREADQERVVEAALSEVTGDQTGRVLLLIPDPPGPVDTRALETAGTAFSWGPRGWGIATRDRSAAAAVLRALFESRCTELTVIAIETAGDLATDSTRLGQLAPALMSRPTPPDAAGGLPFIGLTYEWGDPIRRFDNTGEQPLR